MSLPGISFDGGSDGGTFVSVQTGSQAVHMLTALQEDDYDRLPMPSDLPSGQRRVWAMDLPNKNLDLMATSSTLFLKVSSEIMASLCRQSQLRHLE